MGVNDASEAAGGGGDSDGGTSHVTPAAGHATTRAADSAQLQPASPDPTLPQQPQPHYNIQNPPADRIWDWQQDDEFVPNPHDFDGGQSGIRPLCTLGNNPTELECFQLFFDEPLMDIIVRESNTYYEYTMANTILSPRSCLHQWKDTTVAEMYLFFATIMLMPHVYKHSVNTYWATDRLISTPAFSDIIPVNRFVLLLCMVHFSDKTRPDRSDRLYKIRRVFMYLKQKFCMYFCLFRKLVIVVGMGPRLWCLLQLLLVVGVYGSEILLQVNSPYNTLTMDPHTIHFSHAKGKIKIMYV
nr:uncharacterized protein LOC128704429 isoform X1 [Cherax quadricarinatus]